MDAGQTPGAYRFDRFTLDLARGALLSPDGAEIPLRPKSLALLRLLESAGRVVDRDAIMTTVWPDVVVTDESITQCVRDVRKALQWRSRRRWPTGRPSRRPSGGSCSAWVSTWATWSWRATTCLATG